MPRGSHVSTLYPASFNVEIDGVDDDGDCGPRSTSPDEPKPGPLRMVGAGSSPAAGNQWPRMIVPSKEVMSTSLADPATGWPATDGREAPWSQAVAGAAVVDTAAEVGGAPVVGAAVEAADVVDAADVVAGAAVVVATADVAVAAAVVADDPSSSPEQPAAMSSATTIPSPVVAILR